MDGNEKTLQTLLSIMQISNEPRLGFNSKLQRILQAVMDCMNTEKGSIMLVRGSKNLEVVAATNKALVGKKQPLGQNSPSSWVVKNKKMLYVDSRMKNDAFSRKADRYKKNAFLLAPILLKNKVLGVLSVTEKIGEDTFSEKDQETLLNIVGYLISSVENQRLNESLRSSKKTLSLKNQQLRRLEKVRAELFNMLIHDLKGPLSEVLANLDILSYTATEENLEYVEAAQTSCDTLYRMIADLLDIARLEDGSLAIIPERITPSDLLSETISRVHGQAKIKEIDFQKIQPAAGDANSFWGDRGLLVRVMQNFLVNAVYHSPRESSVEAGYEYPADGKITFFVKDRGPGISPEYQESIFNKYFQVNKKKENKGYSTGLGLTFCKLAVEAHKGEIGVESDGENGSRFYFTLPV